MKMEGYEGEFLCPDDIIYLHDKIINDSEFDDDLGYIDVTGDLFFNSVYHIYSGFGGIDAFPSIEEKAARLCYNIITNHVFRNANKRTGMMAMLEMLDMNSINIKYTQEEMFDIITRVGDGSCSFEELRDFILMRKVDLFDANHK